MKHTHALIFAAVAVSAAAAAPTALASTSCTTVKPASKSYRASLRVEGVSKTLLQAETLTTKTGSFSHRYKGKSYKTSNATLLGLLNLGTKGKWSGEWSTEYGPQWTLDGVLSENYPLTSTAKYFWGVYVNGAQASCGAGEAPLAAGDTVVYAVVPDADYDAELISLATKGAATVGKTLTVNIAADNVTTGKPSALKGASLSYGSKKVTVSGSTARVKLTKAGKLTLKVSKRGYIRDEVTLTVKQ